MLRPYHKYSPEVQLQVCESILSGSMSVLEAQACFGIMNQNSIYQWLRKFDTGKNPPEMSKEKEVDPEVLKARIKALEKRLELEKLRTFSLNTLIDVAEDQLKIKIRKKPPTKQSGK